MLTVKKLREALKGIPDNLQVVQGGADHTYVNVRHARIEKAAMWDHDNDLLSEYYGEQYLRAEESPIQVFLIGE